MEEKPSANCFLSAAKPINRGTLGVVLRVGGGGDDDFYL